MKRVASQQDSAEIERLGRELAEARDTLAAIRAGEVDAFVVGHDDQEIFTLERADMPFRTLVDHMPEGVASLDRGRKIVYGNRFFCQLLAMPESELLSRSFNELLEPEDRATFEAAVSGFERIGMNCNLRDAGGKSVPVQLSILPFDGARRRATVVVSDLRIRQQLDLLVEDRDAARAEIHAKDVFLATLGHELRNPLAALSTGVAVLRSGLNDPARSAGIVDSLERQVRQLTALVNDLLDASRIAQGKITLRPQRIVLKELVDEVTAVVRPMFSARRHDLRIEIEPRDLSLVADPTRVEQILVNLLTNAARYSNDGGQVVLSARAEGEGVVFRIQDSGLGIAPADLERIFEPFTQVTTRGQAGGLGIGLSLVRKLAELHGGEVRAESAGADRGATFVVTLPSAHLADGDLETPAPAANRAGHTVLLVDDNVDATEMMTLLLETAGLRVQSCHFGAEALDLVRTLRPDLVLLDLGLGDMSGLDVARQIREAGHADLRIIAATGYSDAGTMAQVLAAGFNGRLVKPISLPQIMAELPRASA